MGDLMGKDTTRSVASLAKHFTREEIAGYYDTHQATYSRFWSSTALHYGLWYHGTRNLAEAIINTNRFVAEHLTIESCDKVLDAGCGIGGTSIYLAETTGAEVHGITLSKVQLEIAKRRAAISPMADRLSFSLQDYTATTYPNGSFSKIFGIESICYADPKSDFVHEAFRLLRPGGRLAVIDTFLLRTALDPAEQKVYTKFITGWVVPYLEGQDKFGKLLAEIGFRNVEFHDMGQNIEPSVLRVHRFSYLTAPWNYVRAKLGLIPENLSARYQREFFSRGIGTYGAYLAAKPV
jgi:tocopherol O-methyltransferase